MDNNEKLIVDLKDDSGAVVKVEIVEHFEDNGKDYVIANDLSNDTDAYILEVRSTEAGDELISVDDEAEFNRLCEVVDKLEKE
ncbi:MAG: DUF1292 domain-containing protein [Bacilli bacterium]|nr:DUF1292 domain-containing protein [Bacilli bacterium]